MTIDAPEALENFINDMAKLKKNIASIIAISGLGSIGSLGQSNPDDINSLLKNYSLIAKAISDADDLKESAFIHLYNLAIETMTLLSNCEMLLCKFDSENYLQAINSLRVMLD
jgi:hypothetical protein